MPKAKNPLTPEEQRKRFEDEVRKRTSAGDFDPDAADAVLEALVRKAGSSTAETQAPPAHSAPKRR